MQEMKETGQENEGDLYDYINLESTCASVYTCAQKSKIMAGHSHLSQTRQN